MVYWHFTASSTPHDFIKRKIGGRNFVYALG